MNQVRRLPKDCRNSLWTGHPDACSTLQMDYAVIISAIVLGLSILATAAKFLDWFLHSDPKTMVRTVLVAIPLLTMMIAREQWAGAMSLGAGTLVVSLFLKWRAVLAPLRTAFAHFRPKPRPLEMPPVWQDDMAADQHAMLNGDGMGMTVREALEVLGLPDGADVAAVRAAHRRLMRMVDPDTGRGSPYLAAKIDQARDVLIDALRRRIGPTAIAMAEPKRLTTR